MNETNFKILISEHAAYLKPFAIGLTKDHVTAEDLFQETMYRAFYYKDNYKLGTNIKAWLYTIMRNIFINDYRKKGKLNLINNVFENPKFNDNYAGKVDNLAIQNINYKEIKKKIYELPEIFRTPFCLIVDGYSYEEIAKKLNEPIGTIKSRIHFARKTLKQKIVK